MKRFNNTDELVDYIKETKGEDVKLYKRRKDPSTGEILGMEDITERNIANRKFKEAIKAILDNGEWDENPRARWKDGTPANSKFITQYVEKYDISKGEFPITTIKPSAWKTAIKEILWIYQEQSNSLQVGLDKFGIKWWDDWNIGDGTIGYRYGHTVRRYCLMDDLLRELKENPYGRRHIMSLWQNEEFNEEKKGLKPCAFLTMWSVRGKYLDCTLIQRSNDVIAAYNINNIQYVALMMMVAKHCGLEPGVYTRFVQNLHIYDRHIDIAKRYLDKYDKVQPKLIFEPEATNFFFYTIDDFRVEDYHPMEKVDIEIAI